MKTILIRKSGDNLQWRELATTSTHWHYLPPNIRTQSEMKQYFADGKQTNQAWQNWREVQFKLVDVNGTAYQHYGVRQRDNLFHAVVNYDDSKRVTFSIDELWSPAERMRYLRTNAVHLPSEIDNVDDALEYLSSEEPFTVDDYKAQLQKTVRDKISVRCDKHAQGSAAYASVEFTE